MEGEPAAPVHNGQGASAALRPPGRKVGICLSGGGLRAAAFGLGAIQALQEQRGLLRGPEHADYIAAVSGGSYTAGAFAMVSAGPAGRPQLPDGVPDLASALARQLGRPARGSDVDALRQVGEDGHLTRFVRSTAAKELDERKVRWWEPGPLIKWRERRARSQSQLDGIAQGQTEVPWFAEAASGDPTWKTVQPDDPLAPGSEEVQYIRRRTRYLVDDGGAPVIAAIFVVSLVVNLLVIFSVATVFGGAVGVALAGAADTPAAGEHLEIGHISDTWGWLVGYAVVLGLILIGIGLEEEESLDTTPRQVAAGRAIALCAVLAGIVVPAGIVWLWNRLGEPEGTRALEEVARTTSVGALALVVTALAAWLVAGADDLGGRNGATTRGRRILSGLRMLAIGVLRIAASVLLPLVLWGTAVAAGLVSFGAIEGKWPKPILFVALIPALILGLASLIGTNAWALHRPYRRRLFSCFGVLRQEATGGNEYRARRRHPKCEPTLSRCQTNDTPDLLICATANVADVGATPAGTRAMSIVFGPDEIVVRGPGGDKFGTEQLETALNVHGPSPSISLTLPAAVAVTGAAISPAMGKMTIAPLRALMTALNVRLGLWLPNPMNATMRKRVAEAASDPEMKRVAVRPGPLYLLREMFGLLRRDAPFLYVSDGGHSENLGLVELFRRECGEIWCVDASGDPPGAALTIADALIAASGEMGVECDMDLSHFEIDREASAGREVRIRHVHTTGNFSVPIPGGGKAMGVLHVVKLGVDTTTPSVLRTYQRRRPTFPHDSTGHQVYDADLFDAYRLLGYASTAEAAARPAGAEAVPPDPQAVD